MRNRTWLSDLFVWLVVFGVLVESAAIDLLHWLRVRPFVTFLVTSGGYILTLVAIFNAF